MSSEGMLNASLGALAALFGLLASVLMVAALGHSLGPVALTVTLAIASSICATLGILAGYRARRLTPRQRLLANAGYIVCVLALAGAVLAALVAVSRVFV